MKRGDRVQVVRYGTRGRPPPGMQPTVLVGVLVKTHDHRATVDVDGTRIEVQRRQIRVLEGECPTTT